MYVSNCNVDYGIPSAPRVDVTDNDGSMPPGRFYFALVQVKCQSYMDNFIYGKTTFNQTGIEAMGPATVLDIPYRWSTLKVSDIPIDNERQYAYVCMSEDGINFHIIATIPAMIQDMYKGHKDYGSTTDFEQENGLYTIVIRNPAAKYRVHAGSVIQRNMDEKMCDTYLSQQEVFDENSRLKRIPPVTAFQPTNYNSDNDNIAMNAINNNMNNMNKVTKAKKAINNNREVNRDNKNKNLNQKDGLFHTEKPLFWIVIGGIFILGSIFWLGMRKNKPKK